MGVLHTLSCANKCGMPVPLMKLQCESGLKRLGEGRTDGIIFLGNTVMDLGYESVAWTHDWIRRVGDTRP